MVRKKSTQAQPATVWIECVRFATDRRAGLRAGQIEVTVVDGLNPLQLKKKTCSLKEAHGGSDNIELGLPGLPNLTASAYAFFLALAVAHAGTPSVSPRPGGWLSFAEICSILVAFGISTPASATATIGKWLGGWSSFREDTEGRCVQLFQVEGKGVERRFRLNVPIGGGRRAEVELAHANPASLAAVAQGLGDSRSHIRESATELIDRPVYMTQIVRAMSDQSARIVVLYGRGGFGKTTLARMAQRETKERFSLSKFIDLRHPGSRSNRGTLLSSVGETLTGQQQAVASGSEGDSWLRQLVAAHTEHGQALFILDNADHPEPDFAEGVRALAAVTNVHVLLTTRDAYLAQALCQRPLAVHGFTLDETRKFLSDRLGPTVFTDHLKRSENIFQKTGGKPLSLLHIANAIALGHATFEMASESLAEVPGLLKVEDTSLSLSIPYLTTEEHSAFNALAVCAPVHTTTLAVAAAAHMSATATEQALHRLADLGLVLGRAEAREWCVQPLHYDLLRKDPGFGDSARRHADWCLSMIGGSRRDLDRIQPYEAELRAAVDNCRAICDYDRLIRTCRAMEYYWRYRGPWEWAKDAIEAARRAAADCGDVDNHARFLYTIGSILLYQGHLPEALQTHRTRLALDRHHGRAAEYYIGHEKCGEVLAALGETVSAEQELATATSLARQHNIMGRTRALTIMVHAQILITLKRFDDAEQVLDEAWSHLRDLVNEDIDKSRWYRARAQIHLARGELQEAEALTTKAHAITLAARVLPLLARDALNLGIIRFCRGDVETSAVSFQEALTSAMNIGDVLRMARAHHGLSCCSLVAGLDREAMLHVERGIENYRAAQRPEDAARLRRLADQALSQRVSHAFTIVDFWPVS